MAKRKYEKYFISGISPEAQAKRPYADIALMDGNTFLEECNF